MYPFPRDEVSGVCIPVGEYAWRERTSAARVRWVLAHPEGCLVVVRVVARRLAEGPENWEGIINRFSERVGGDMVVARIVLDDGSVSHSTNPLAAPDWGPIFEFQVGVSSDDESFDLDLTYWITPVPPESFSFELWSDRLGRQGAVVLDGAHIIEAGARAEPDWLD